MPHSRSASAPPLLKPLFPLLTALAVALVVAILSVADRVFVPLALAVFLAFILTPPAEALERLGLRRAGSVAVVVAVALGALGGFGYVISRQVADLSARLSEYSGSIRAKVAVLRGTGAGPIEAFQRTVGEVTRDLEGQTADLAAAQPVRVVQDAITPLERIGETIGPVVEPLATAGIVLVLVVFMLSQREDLRNRLIRLVGKGRITLTTRTLDEVGRRISRYLLTQVAINTAFGTVVTIGLLWIGLPYAVLWGALALVLRFVPYVGSMLALALPTVLAFAVFPTWRETLLTLALFLTMDGVTAYVVEPLLVGHRTGVSSVALLVSAVLWTWLWGPIGLLLATPITVCLAVLGKHVPQLEFLGVLFGDEPALDTETTFYQRLLAGDEDEAAEIAERQLQSRAPEQVFDSVLVPALILAERDRRRGEITDAEQQFVLQAVREIVEDVAAQTSSARAADPAGGDAAGGRARGYVLGVPARSARDELGLEMLVQLLDPARYEFERTSTAMLASEVLSAVERRPPDLVCVAALPPGGLAHARYLCKRLRLRFPGLRILVVRPEPGAETDRTASRLRDAGADEVAAGLTEARTTIVLLQSALIRPALVPDTPSPLGVAGTTG